MNRLHFEIQPRPAAETRTPQDSREHDVWLLVDKVTLNPPHVQIGTYALDYSLYYSGELDIFTCACGEPLCAGVERGVHVRHAGAHVIWRVPLPVSRIPDEDRPRGWRGYRFHYPQYRQAILEYVAQLRRLNEPWITGAIPSGLRPARPAASGPTE